MNSSFDEKSDAEMDAMFDGIPLRREPSSEATAQAYAKVKAEWQLVVSTRRNKRWQKFGAVAATVLVLVIISVLQFPNNTAVDMRIAQGAITADHGVLTTTQPTRLALNAIEDIRLSQGTRFEIINPAEIRLLQGDLYVDTKDRANIKVRSNFGIVSDIGTRFLVSVDQHQMTVGVRQGEVLVDSKHGLVNAAAKNQLARIVQINATDAQVHTELASSTRWDWIHAVPPGYRQATVAQTTLQIADDLGVPVVYASRSAELMVMNADFGGQLTDIEPRRALDMLFHGSELEYVLNPDALTISLVR
ncbi:MAG: FecR domain-containing protein [Gammaproteobacteria bacterium]|nr:FecR domain-containing protein [Gammaproteobacteria bacterium]